MTHYDVEPVQWVIRKYSTKEFRLEDGFDAVVCVFRTLPDTAYAFAGHGEFDKYIIGCFKDLMREHGIKVLHYLHKGEQTTLVDKEGELPFRT